MADVEEDFSKLPLEARLTHKAWKARQQAYDELSKQFKLVDSQKDPIFKEYHDIIRKLPSESNAVVLENSLNCLIAYLDCASIDAVKRMRGDLLPALIEKGLGAQRMGAKNKAVECFHLLVELENGESVINELCATFVHKQPKLAAAAVNCTCELLRAFGPQIISVKIIGKHLTSIFGNPDKNVRAEATQLTVEIYRWIGIAINAFLGDIKAIQAKELQELFTKETFGQCKPSKYLRSSKPQIQNTPAQMTPTMPTELEVVQNVTKPIDAFDLVDPIDVLDKLPADFDTLVASSNWKERKDALSALLLILKVPRIMDGHFGDLIDHLLKRVSDVNVMVVVVAANCLEALISGLRNLFVSYRSVVLSALLERCKEKKTNVVDALRGALDSLFLCIQTFESVSEDLKPFLIHKNPQIKAETFAWLGRLLPHLKQPINKKEVKSIVETCIPGLDDGATEVRDAAARTIAKLYQLNGEKNVVPLLDGVDKIKVAKITEFAKETDDSLKQAPVTVAQSIPTTTNLSEKKVVVQESIKVVQKQGKQFDPSDYTVSPKCTESDAEDFFSKILPKETIALFNDSVWKTRLTAVEELASKVDQMCYTEGFDTELLVLFLNKYPSWKDSNFQVIGKMITICQQVSKQHPFSKEAIASLIPEIVDKLSDPKLKKSTEELLLTLSEQTYCGFILHHIYEASKSQKSPKNLTEIVIFIQSCLLEFGTLQGINMKELIDFVKVQLGNSNATLRSASVNLVGTIGCLMNQDIMPLFGDVQPQLRSTLQAELSKGHEPIISRRKQKYFTSEEHPTQSSSTTITTTLPNSQTQESIPIQSEPMDDLIPRVDITASITPAILAQLADPNWKVRREGLDQVAAIVDAANRRVKLTSGELYNELRARLGDSNKILVMQALSLCASLAEAGGQTSEKYIRSVISAIISCLADGKIQVRQEALNCLDQIIQVSPMSAVISQASSCILTDSPNLRKELLTWLASKLPFYKSFSTEEALSLVQPCLNCLQDRTAEVRKAAQGILGPLAIACGMQEFKRKCIEVQSNIWTTIQPFIESYKPIEAPPSQQTTSTINLPMKRQASTPRKTEPEQPKRLLFFASLPDQKVLRADKDKGSLKWNGPDGFVIRQDLIDILHEQFSSVIDANLSTLLFSDDFKLQLQGMSLIESSAEENSNEIINCLDLLLKYLIYRMVENNPTVFLKCLDLLERFVSLADRSNYRLSEYEGSCLLPSLILKSGESKDSLRPRLRQLFRQICRIYPASKLFTHLIDGLKAKGAKTRSECLEEMNCLLTRNGLSVLIPAKHVPIIGTMVGDRDANVRSAALNVLVQTATLLGDQSALLKHLSSCSQKELDMFEERMKRSKNPTMIVDEDAKSSKSNSVDEIIGVKEGITTPAKNNNTPSKFRLEYSTDAPTPRQKQSIFSDPTPVLNVRPFPISQAALPHPLDHIVDQVLTAADLPCIQALQRLDEHLSQPNEDTVARLDNLIAALSIRLRECCDPSSTAYLSKDAEMRTLKGRMSLQVVNSLLLLIEDKNLVTRIDTDRLHQLIFETLNSLVSQPINHLYDEHETLVKHINALLINILENARYDACFSALLSILEQIFLTPPTTTSKLHELTMKCLWKITKQMHTRHSELNINVLLQAAHRFFSSISPIEWKSRAAEKMPHEDMPLRTVKTILNELAQAVGPRVLDEAKENLPKSSFVISYLLNMVNSTTVKGSNVSTNPSPGGLVQPSSTSMIRLNREELYDRLKIICSQICSKPDTNLGLMELYRFKQEHSYASSDIDTFLTSLGEFFYKYITRSLIRIESEQAQQQAHQQDNSPSETSADSFKTKLAQLRRQMFGSLGGSASSSTERVNDDIKMSPISTRISNSPSLKPRKSDTFNDTQEEGKSTTSSIVGLKERLARLRGGQHND